MTEPRKDAPVSQSNSDVVTTHTPFRTDGVLTVACNCGWKTTMRRQNAATAAAKCHVDMYPGHEVLTTRVQSKITYSRKRAQR